MPTKIMKSVRVSQDGLDLWEATAQRLGLSLTATLELAVRAFAQQNGITQETLKQRK